MKVTNPASRTFRAALLTTVFGTVVFVTNDAVAQNAPSGTAQQQQQPTGEQQPLPEVQVIQERQQPRPRPRRIQARRAAPPPPAPVAPPPVEVVEETPEQTLPNTPYGAANSAGAAARAQVNETGPINPTSIIPTDLSRFSAAATNVTPETLQERQPRNINEVFTRVPGVIVINDDANAHHGGVAVRGAPARRSRKMLVMEDGHPVNLALWLDPSVHYWGPLDRYESVEVIRGTVINYGPNNNFGVINARNLSPFGPEETVISSAIGFTKNRAGFFINEDGDVLTGGGGTDTSGKWHVHTRQTSENFGAVFSYSGADVQGVWDTERLNYHDFHGALGWKGTDSDLVVSVTHARQRDKYDEQNFLGEAGLGDFEATDEDSAVAAAEAFAEANGFIGFAERAFFNVGSCKSCYAPFASLNNYNGDIWRSQITYNAYLDDDTTLTARVYAGHHRRDRYQLNTFESEPDGTLGAGPVPDFDVPAPGDQEDSSVFFGENTMFGRLRTFRHLGAEVRAEFANRDFFGLKQDIQTGIRYEYQDMTNRNFLGREGEILENGDEEGFTIFDRELDSSAVSAFLQTNISVASNFNVVPGIRFEWYKVNRVNRVIAREESEAGGAEGPDCAPFDPPDLNPGDPGYDDDLNDSECLELDGLVFNPLAPTEGYDTFNALPGVSFAYTGLYRSTIFGGYHRGLSTGVLRNEDFPVEDEIGNNFTLGFRSTAVRGVDFEVAGFYQLLENYQFGASFTDAADRSFGRAEEVEISGVEVYGRLNSRPYTGGPFNVFAEGNYTYSRGIFKEASEFDDDGNVVGNFNGNRIPEVPLHVAAITLGIENFSGWRWDASATWAYRGGFFTDEGNTPYGFGGEVECEEEGPGAIPGTFEFECEIEEAGEDGFVPSVWLLSARFNLDIGDSGASVFVAGDNLLNELYISDREDGMKPGLGRTIWAGFKYKF